MKVCKEEFCYLYEANISPICSVPTVHDLIRKFQRYSDQLEKVNTELAEKKEKGYEISDPEQSSGATSVDSCIDAGQKSPPRKNILDFSCSDECTCDRCTHFKFAVDSSDQSSYNQDLKQPTWYSTPLQRMSKIDFNPSQDSFKLKNVAFSYLSDLDSKIERIRKLCEDKDDEDYFLTLIDSLEKTSAILDPLL